MPCKPTLPSGVLFSTQISWLLSPELLGPPLFMFCEFGGGNPGGGTEKLGGGTPGGIIGPPGPPGPGGRCQYEVRGHMTKDNTPNRVLNLVHYISQQKV